jgi:hypothetical protein
MNSDQFRIDVCACGAAESLTGYPKHGGNEARAHALAEEAVSALHKAGNAGEYFVVVAQNGSTPISTQVVVVSALP